VASSKIWSFFDRDGHFLARQMVNFSSLHDKERLAEVGHQLHSIELVNALQMVVSSSILGVSSSRREAAREGMRGKKY
jgi:hypothetical protein